MGNKILLIGGGGNCRSILDVLLESNSYNEIGIVDDKSIDFKMFSDKISYVGTDKELENLFKTGWDKAFISIGSVGDTSIRRRLYNEIKRIGFSVPNIISRFAFVSNNSVLGEGVFVSKGAVVNIGSNIGNCCIINSNSTIEHDCRLGDFVHVSPGSTLCGGVSIGSDTHVGAGSIIKQYINVGNNTLIGMGSIVLNNLDSDSIYYGTPCRFIKKR